MINNYIISAFWTQTCWCTHLPTARHPIATPAATRTEAVQVITNNITTIMVTLMIRTILRASSMPPLLLELSLGVCASLRALLGCFALCGRGATMQRICNTRRITQMYRRTTLISMDSQCMDSRSMDSRSMDSRCMVNPNTFNSKTSNSSRPFMRDLPHKTLRWTRQITTTFWLMGNDVHAQWWRSMMFMLNDVHVEWYN